MIGAVAVFLATGAKRKRNYPKLEQTAEYVSVQLLQMLEMMDDCSDLNNSLTPHVIYHRHAVFTSHQPVTSYDISASI